MAGLSTINNWSSACKSVEPRGAIILFLRDIIAITALSGKASCEIRLPTARDEFPKVYSTISASTSPKAVISNVAAGVTGGGNVNLSFLAIQAKLDPCNVAEINTTKNTTLKIKSAPGKPNINGNIASIIGTEPRRPIQDTRVISRRLKPNSAKIGNTANGLAIKINTKAITSPSNHTSNNEVGVIKSPSTTNMVIWLNQAKPSWNKNVLRWNTNRLLPITTPVIKTAKKPLPPILAVIPNESKPHAATNTGYNPAATNWIRLISRTDNQPTANPTAIPKPICDTNITSKSLPGFMPFTKTSNKPIVKNIAIGSFEALSISKVAFNFPFKWMPALRSNEKTAAASVEPTIAPSNMPCSKEISKI